ncbi:MAG: DUF4396 domain-containing protein [Gluconacetobacter diazotrophicus]|nr:DUF4396 domain-containing protein [Gluconacetobacter diazotrophicus]
MPPEWLNHLAAVYVPLSIASALLVLGDILVLRRRQPMAIMDAVWPLTMLYWGPPGLVFYGWFGRAPARPASGHGGDHDHGNEPMWQATFNGATHCGAGCALGDFLGDWLAFGAGLALFGSPLVAELLLAFCLAYAFGILFQFFSVAPMRGLGLRDGLVAAARIDTLSLLAYEVGMFAAMVARARAFPHLAPTTWTYWLLMQAAMVLGFATTYPINWWLVARGIKEKM